MAFGKQTTAMSFLVQTPAIELLFDYLHEQGYRTNRALLHERQDAHDRVQRYALRFVALHG